MRIRELLAVESIDLNAKAANKKEALDHAVDLMARSGKIGRQNATVNTVMTAAKITAR